MTFSQMLVKFGYIQEDKSAQKNKKRPWHVKEIKGGDSSDDDKFWVEKPALG